ncbi:MAG: hypothetical protein RIS49_368, partial [Actinomycetota bacterium]
MKHLSIHSRARIAITTAFVINGATVGASLTMEKEKTTEYFNRSLIEMGVNTGIVLALVFALFLSRAARKPG